MECFVVSGPGLLTVAREDKVVKSKFYFCADNARWITVILDTKRCNLVMRRFLLRWLRRHSHTCNMMGDQGDEELILPMEISKETYDNALTYYQRKEEQKNVFLSVSIHFIVYIYQLSCYTHTHTHNTLFV